MTRRERAYFLWLNAGEPEGMSDYFWQLSGVSPKKEPERERPTCNKCGAELWWDACPNEWCRNGFVPHDYRR